MRNAHGQGRLCQRTPKSTKIQPPHNESLYERFFYGTQIETIREIVFDRRLNMITQFKKSCSRGRVMETKKQQLGTQGRTQQTGREDVAATSLQRSPRENQRQSRSQSMHNGRGRAVRDRGTSRLATGLGWFSIGFGLAELLAPGTVANIAGVSKKHTRLIRLYGLREIATGVGIFSQRRPSEALWSRVAGDALDLATLGNALTSQEAKRGRVAFATASVLGVTALDLMCAQQLSKGRQGIHARSSIIVNRTPDEVYQFWRDFTNLPHFMRHLESVEDFGDGRSHWVAKGLGGISVAWDAEIVADIPGEVITWRSRDKSDVQNAGGVRFELAPGRRGTIVKVNIEYNPPGGVVAATIAKLFGEEPEQQLEEDLQRFKQVMEVGEVVISDATLFGAGYMEQRPAQPPSLSELEQASNQLPVKPTARAASR